MRIMGCSIGSDIKYTSTIQCRQHCRFRILEIQITVRRASLFNSVISLWVTLLNKADRNGVVCGGHLYLALEYAIIFQCDALYYQAPVPYGVLTPH